MKVLDHGEVTLVDHMGSDLSVVAAARVSNGITADASKGDEADRRLIAYLLKHNHGSPFEHTSLTYRVRAPLFVVRQWQRHRVGWSYNEESARYTELTEGYYVPTRIRVPAATNKQGSVEAAWDDEEHESMARYIRSVSDEAFARYRWLLKRGVAREMARMVLPQNTYTTFYATCNARSLMHFLGLRSKEDAQWEIRQYAEALETLWAEVMPVTASAWRSASADKGSSPESTSTGSNSTTTVPADGTTAVHTITLSSTTA